MAIDLGAVALAVTPDMANFGSDVEQGVEEHTSSFKESGRKIATAVGAGMAAAGAAAEGFARSQQESNIALEGMARRAGTGSDAMRDMARDMQNATFPMDEVVGLMELATKRGLEGEAIKEYGNFWDMVGDATGESSQQLAEAGIALGQVGIAAGDEAEALDAFGFITDNTTQSVSDFLRFTERTGKELGENTPHVNDMAAALAALEDDGMSARVAQQELQQALRESDGDMDAALETLGLSGSAYDDLRSEVEGSGAAIRDQAGIVADSMTPMQKMQSQVESIMLEYGGLADAAGMVAAPLSGVGMAMMGVAQVGPSVVGATKKVGGALGGMAKSAVTSTATVLKQMALQVAAWIRVGAQSLIHAAKVATAWLISMGPIAIVIAAVVGLVALIIKNWDTIKKVIAAGWEWVKRVTARVWDAIWDFLKKLWSYTLPGLIFNNIDKIKRFISDGLDKIKKTWNRIWTAVKDFVSDRFADVVGYVKGLPRNAKRALMGTWSKFSGFWEDKFDAIKDFVSDKIEDIVDFFKGLPGRIVDALGDVAGKIKDKFSFDLPDISIPFVGGDGPGAPPGGGGSALSRVQSALMPGTYVTSTYRSPAQNRRVGGSPTSYHLDRNNPAVDIGGSTRALDAMASKLRAMGGWREFLWQTAGHYDHIHVAHEGGEVTADGIKPLRRDELLAKLQHGETVLPANYDSGRSGQPDAITIYIGRDKLAEVVRKGDRRYADRNAV